MFDTDIDYFLAILTKSSVLLNFLVGLLIVVGLKYLDKRLSIQDLRNIVLLLL